MQIVAPIFLFPLASKKELIAFFLPVGQVGENLGWALPLLQGSWEYSFHNLTAHFFTAHLLSETDFYSTKHNPEYPKGLHLTKTT